MPTLSDICKSINLDKDVDLINDYTKSDYVPFIVNRIYSLYPDTVLIANEINKFPFLEKEMQYKYYVYSVRKRKRFSPWLKYQLPDEVKLVKEYYSCSTKKAKDLLKVLSTEDLQNIAESLDKGGIQNDRNTNRGNAG